MLGFALGPIGAAALSLVSLPILAWIFPPLMIGQLSMLQVAIRLSTLLCCLGLDQAYVREYHEAIDKPRLLLNATVPGLVILALGCLLIIFAPGELSNLLYGDRSVPFAVLTIVCLLMAYVVRFLSLVLRMQDRGLAFSMSQILAKLLLLVIALTYAFAFTRRDFLMLLGAQTLAWAACFFVFAWNTRKEWLQSLRAQLDRADIRKLLAFGGPLALGGVASWALVAMDRIFLRSMSTYNELAIYSVAASIASGAAIIGSIFNIIWAPMVYKWHAQNADPRRVDRIAGTMLVLICLAVCVSGGMSPILRIMLPHAYSEAAVLLPLCVVPPLLYTLSEVTGIGIEIKRKTMLSMLASIAAVGFNVLLCAALVPPFGAMGAATATAVAFWVFFVVRTVSSTRVWVNRFTPWHHLVVFGMVGMALLMRMAGTRWYEVVVIVWWVMATVVLAANRRRLLSLVLYIIRALRTTTRSTIH